MRPLLKDKTFDVTIIGGGATGCGLALDAASRGLKTLLLEKNDFASGTSSKSSKLLHGGVRYLESALKHFDKGQYHLVKEALKERYLLLHNAPHLCHPLKFLVPLYKCRHIPYYFAGLALYDFIAASKSLGKTKLFSAKQSKKLFPLIKGKGLKAGITYLDGQFNDSRLSLSLAKTAEKFGATLLTYAEVKEFILEQGKITGLSFLDRLNNQTLEIKSKVIINATGPWLDKIRKLANPSARDLLIPSKGSHLALKLPITSKLAILLPKTQDKRVLFLLPWSKQYYFLGTTDIKTDLNTPLKPTDSEIDYLLNHFQQYFDYPLQPQEITSCWAGIRPLLKSSEKTSTASLSREHYIEIMPNNLVSIGGGKWTTFRKMAQETLDLVIAKFKISAKKCQTHQITLWGSKHFSPTFKHHFLAQKKFSQETLEHLLHTYGDKAPEVLALASKSNLNEPILPGLPYILAEVAYCLKEEYVFDFLDFLARRIDLAQINLKECIRALNRIEPILAESLNWDQTTCKQKKKRALEQLQNSTF